MSANRFLLFACTVIFLSACQRPETGTATSSRSQIVQLENGQKEQATVTTFTPEKIQPTQALIQQLKLPDGFEISVFRENLGNPRMMAVDAEGRVFVTRPESGDVIVLEDANQDGVAEKQKTAVSGLAGVHGLAFHREWLYLATPSTLYRARIQDSQIAKPIRIASLPAGGRHPHRTIGLAADGKVLVSIGSTCNACAEENPEHAAMIEMSPDGAQRKVFARGLRNTIGFAWHPETGELWGMDIGSDWVGADIPPEELNNLTGGGDFGWPWCYGNRQIDPEMRSNALNMDVETYCSNTKPAVLTYQAHSSPIGFVFYKGRQFPDEYRGDAFVAMRGSWNRKPAVGYKVVRIEFENGKPVAMHDFLTGFLVHGGREHFARLAGVAVARDGALLVSDDANGVIYRVSTK